MRHRSVVTLALLAALSGSAFAAEARSRERKPEAFDARATAYARPTVLPFLGLLPYTSSVHGKSDHETDGLSRNPDDCVRWGCIDH